MLSQKRILLGITGGIAAYKAAEIVRQLKKAKAEVYVVMTDAAKQFITPLTLHTLSLNPVFSTMFDLTEESRISHIELARWADVMLIAPATADFIAKGATGLADDLLSTIFLATTSKIVIAPAMNRTMWENPITQRNIRALEELRNVVVVPPQKGELACGEEGAGRLAEIDKILDAVNIAACSEKDLEGEKVLVSAGPTIEDIDPVRYLTNRSSGKMGYAIAKEAAARGAEVVLVSGPTSLPDPFGVTTIRVRSAEEMYNAVKENLKGSKIVVMAAAVADFKPVRTQTNKIKKTGTGVELKLKPTTDILAEITKIRTNRPFVVGFAAESAQIIQNAKDKLKRKKLDLIVANDITSPHAGFEKDTNVVYVIDKQGHVEEWPIMSKEEVAKNLMDYVQKLRAKKQRRSSRSSSRSRASKKR